MIIPMKDGDGNLQWIAIELHGNLKSFEQHFSEYEIGDLYFKKNEEVVLHIGSYILEGKEMPLEKPMAILEKKYVQTGMDEQYDVEKEPNYVVTTIVKKKLIFRSRPKPIIIKVAKCN